MVWCDGRFANFTEIIILCTKDFSVVGVGGTTDYAILLPKLVY